MLRAMRTTINPRFLGPGNVVREEFQKLVNEQVALAFEEKKVSIARDIERTIKKKLEQLMDTLGDK